MSHFWDIVVGVTLGTMLTLALAFVFRILLFAADERRAVKQFRECYRSARLTAIAVAIATGEDWTEAGVMSLALEAMKVREDVKAGKHRFGESASDIIARTPYNESYLVG